MPFNIPTYTSDNFSFGPGVLFIGVAGTTPTADVGAVKEGAELAVTREVLEVKLGSTQNLVKQYVTQEKVQLTVKGIEWNLINLARALGAGVTATSASQDSLGFGGDINMLETAVRFRHVLPTGQTIYVDLWKASPAGENTITFGLEPHEFPFVFKALDSTTNWAGAALTDNSRLMKITRVKQ